MIKSKILVIDDDEATALCIQELFSFENCHVTLCTDGISGLNAIINDKPELVILDLMIPGLSGDEIVNKLHTLKIKVPIILISAFTHLPERAKSLGIDHYHSKPFEFDALFRTALSLLNLNHP